MVQTETNSASADMMTGTNVALLREFLSIAAGRSSVEPGRGDRRFTDAQWNENPVLRRLMQGYLAASLGANRAVERLTPIMGPKRAESARFATNLVVGAASPTNFLVSNPAALRKAVETRGKSLARGTRNLVDDVRHNGGLPSMVDPDAFEEAAHRLDKDDSILEWVKQNGAKHSPETIEHWNETMIARHPDTAAKKARFTHFLKESGGAGRKDIKTYFDLIEFDEGRLK